MSQILKDKITLITGASQGIGAAVAKAYAAEGAHVILLARNQKKLEAVDDEIREAGGQATLMPLDLQRLDDIAKLGPSIYERFGKLDVFVGNAGLLGTLGPLAQISDAEFDRVMMVNLTANFRLIKTLDPLLQAAPKGRALFVSTSPSVTIGRAYWGTYSVSKAALESMVRVYADEVQSTHLRVNLINPGAVRTDMRASAVPGENPMSLLHPDNIVSTFIDLASDECKKHGEIVQVCS